MTLERRAAMATLLAGRGDDLLVIPGLGSTAWDAAAAGPGNHAIEVRATDGTGETQTEQRTSPAPDGARGWHTIKVQVG